MNSASSRRTAPLPPDWPEIRDFVLTRDDGNCLWGLKEDETDNVPCPVPATEVDHMGDPSDHRPEMLRSICTGHHRTRTGRDANAVRWANHRARKSNAEEKHPGLK